MTNPKNSTQSEWSDCQGGEISGLVRRLKTQRAISRRKQMTQSLSIAAGLLVMVGIGWMMLPGDNSPMEANYGGIVCSDVVKNGKQFVLKELAPELADRIKVHLGQCDHCQKKLTMLRDRLGLTPQKMTKSSPINRQSFRQQQQSLLLCCRNR